MRIAVLDDFSTLINQTLSNWNWQVINGQNWTLEDFKKNANQFEGIIIRSKFPLDRKHLTLAKKTGARLNVFHISTAKELNLFDNKVQIKDKNITAEVCAHHLWFTDKDYEKLGSRIKWNPAIKTQTDKDALWKAINDDTIDIIASDHAPHTEEEKNNDYLSCPSGGPMVQHTILSLLQNCEKYGVSIEKIVEKISHNPSIIFEINKRGFLREGYYADIVIIDTNTPTLVTKDSLLYKCGWSPFEGVKFNNSINKTIINGRIAYADSKINSVPWGKKLTFKR